MVCETCQESNGNYLCDKSFCNCKCHIEPKIIPKSMLVQNVNLSEIVHKVMLGFSPHLERLEERLLNIEILLTSKNEIEKEQIKIILEESIETFKEKIKMRSLK